LGGTLSIGGLAMDTSIRLKFLLGTLQVPTEEISEQEWLEIVKAILRWCKHLMKYFTGFKPIGEKMFCYLSAYDRRSTEEHTITFPEGFDRSTRCINVAGISHDTEGDLGCGQGVCFFLTKDMLLTQEGKLVLWDAKYERVPHNGLGYRNHRSGIEEVAVYSKFEFISDSMLLALLQDRKVCNSILVRIYMMVEESIKDRQHRLESLQCVAATIGALRERVGSL
jgi:hypothetical protein